MDAPIQTGPAGEVVRFFWLRLTKGLYGDKRREECTVSESVLKERAIGQKGGAGVIRPANISVFEGEE